MAESGNNELKAVQDALAALWPLDGEARARAVGGIAAALGVVGAPAFGAGVEKPQFGTTGAGSSNEAGDLGTPKQFLAHKAPTTDVERVTALGYYLTHARGNPHFKTRELTELNIEAAGSRISNTAYAASNATKKMGYLAAGPGGTKQITARGEALVGHLPDRSAAKAAVDALPGKPRRSSGRKKKGEE